MGSRVKVKGDPKQDSAKAFAKILDHVDYIYAELDGDHPIAIKGQEERCLQRDFFGY